MGLDPASLAVIGAAGLSAGAATYEATNQPKSPDAPVLPGVPKKSDVTDASLAGTGTPRKKGLGATLFTGAGGVPLGAGDVFKKSAAGGVLGGLQ